MRLNVFLGSFLIVSALLNVICIAKYNDQVTLWILLYSLIVVLQVYAAILLLKDRN